MITRSRYLERHLYLIKKVKKVRLYATAYGVYEVAELLGAAPQAKPLYDAVVNALNAKCKNNK